MRAPGWCYEAFAVDGELAESFPTYPLTGGGGGPVVALRLSLGNAGLVQGLMAEGIVGGCAALAEGSVQQGRREDRC